MAITLSEVLGLDLAFFGEPYVLVANAQIPGYDSLDLAFFGEPVDFQYTINNSVVYDATKMFLMF